MVKFGVLRERARETKTHGDHKHHIHQVLDEQTHTINKTTKTKEYLTKKTLRQDAHFHSSTPPGYFPSHLHHNSTFPLPSPIAFVLPRSPLGYISLCTYPPTSPSILSPQHHIPRTQQSFSPASQPHTWASTSHYPTLTLGRYRGSSSCLYLCCDSLVI